MNHHPHLASILSRGLLAAILAIAMSLGCVQDIDPVDPDGDDTPRVTSDAGNDPDRGPSPSPDQGFNGQPDTDQPDTNQPDTNEPDTNEPDTNEPDSPVIESVAEKSRVIFLIDRSGSMAEPGICERSPCPSRWQQLTGLGVYLAEIKQEADLGLALFPSTSGNGCNVDVRMSVPLNGDPDVDEQILDALAAAYPAGRTPLAAALDQVALMGGLDDPDDDNVLVILTDGRPNCVCSSGDDECEREAAVAAAQRLVDAGSNLNLYVVGFGAAAAAAHETLDAVASVTGGTYYQVDTIEDLIGKLYNDLSVAPCSYLLDEWPEPENLVVWIDGERADACTDEPCDRGYTYDRSTGQVAFQGETCEDLRDGDAHDVWFETTG